MVWKPLVRLLSITSSRATRGSNGSSRDGRADVSHGGLSNAPSTVAQAPAVSNPEPGSPNVSLQEELEDDSSDTASTISVSSKDEVEKTNFTETFAAPAFRAIPEPRDRNGEDVLELEKRYGLSSLRVSKNTKPFTENHDLMDDMLDGVLQVRSFDVAKDISKNMEAVEQSKSEGVKSRDFAVKSTPQDLTAALKDKPVVELFLPYEKTLQFFYMRFLINNGVYDLPRYSLTVEDVDRLHTCGMINAHDLDNVVLCSMMGHGTYRRLKRSTGSPTYSGAVVPPRGPWTVPVNYRRPSRDEIISYIASHEQTRFNKYYAINLYRIAAFERPLMTEEYSHHRIQRDGFWGLKRMAAIEDEEAIKLFLEKDPSFIAPGTKKHQELLALSPVDAKFQDARPSSSPGIQYVPDADTSERPSPVVCRAPAAPESTSAGAEVVPSTPFRGRSSDSKGKKRARSPSTSSERDDVNINRARRTRARVSDKATSPPAPKNTSPRPARTLRRSTRRITERLPLHKPPTASRDVPVSLPAPTTAPSTSSSKGKKRTRDDETEQEDLDESSPTKKVKATGDVTPTSPTNAARPSSKGKKRAREHETEGEGLVESSPTKKVKDCGDVAPTGFTDACGLSNPLSEATSATTLVIPRAAGSSKSPTPESNAVVLVPVAVGPSNTSIHRSPMPTPVAPVPASQPSSASLQTATVTPAPNGAVHMPIVPARTLRRTETIILPLKTQRSTTAGRSCTAPPHLPDTERGKQWARIDGINIHSWAELCARPKQSPLIAEQQERKESQVPEVAPEKVKGPRAPVGAVAEGLDAQTQTESSQNVPPTLPPVRRPLTRQHMVYLDEVYPCFHPHHYGTNLIRQPMRYLDEVLPEVFPKWVPSEATS